MADINPNSDPAVEGFRIRYFDETANPVLTIGWNGTPIEIFGPTRRLCRLDVDGAGRWTASYNPDDLDEAARLFLDAVNSIASTGRAGDWPGEHGIPDEPTR